MPVRAGTRPCILDVGWGSNVGAPVTAAPNGQFGRVINGGKESRPACSMQGGA